MTNDDDTQLNLPLPARKRVRLREDELPAKRTGWYSGIDPAMPGWYEVLDLAGNTLEGLWWWYGANWRRSPLDGRGRSTVVPGPYFQKEYAWRGLAQPANEVYPCPPYSSEVLGAAAQAAGVTIRTPHIIYMRTQRKRVRLDQE